MVAVALQTGLWIWNGNTGDATALLDTSTMSEKVGGGNLITGLRWDADGNILAVGLEGGLYKSGTWRAALECAR